jgi:hypothetical protein
MLSDNFDGAFDTSTKTYLIEVLSLYEDYIPDTSVQIIGKNVTTNYSNNTFSFDTSDSSVVFRCVGYYDLEIELPNIYEDWKLILIQARLKPIISEFKNNSIEFKYNKKKGLANLNGVTYKVEIE